MKNKEFDFYEEVKNWSFDEFQIESEDLTLWDLYEELAKVATKDSKVLDLGTGGGEKVLKSFPECAEILGTDYSPAMIETANENLKTPNLVLFGNKADLDKSSWKVTKQEAEDFANKLNIKYFETSAHTRQGLEEGFASITNDTYNRVKGTKDGEGGVKIKKDDDEYVTGCFGKKKKKNKKKF